MRERLIEASAVLGAWVAVLLLWIAFAMTSGISFIAALPRSILTIGIAAILGFGVWRLCRAMPWPRRPSLRFCAVHLVAAALYGSSWMIINIALEPLITGRSVWGILRTPRALTWLLTSVWLYAVIAGVSYAIQAQRRALIAEAGLSAARLDALQNRLHPHFLFNALHTVAALVRQDSAQAESAIEKLGDMLRYTLQPQTENIVPFAEEWEFTRRYLDFEQLRYGDRLRVEPAIDPDCMTCSAPLFALQTLVENAVRHSIATRPEGGRIAITARADEKKLFVQVRDDGGNGAAAQDGSHFGLHALRERLSAVYGNESQLVIDSNPSGFEVSFAVPRTRAGEADDE